MDVREAIRTRRTVARYRPERVPRAVLVSVLEAGIWAPNHHLTEPWRFVVIGPTVQQQLAERFGELRAERIPADAAELRERARQDAVATFGAIPALVAVASEQVGDAQRQAEDYAATCCAVQNIQLAAWAEGIGVKWSTSAVTRDPLAYELLGLDPLTLRIVGFLFVGYPAEIPTRPRQKSLDDVVRWTD